jgi:hypothetical protein
MTVRRAQPDRSSPNGLPSRWLLILAISVLVGLLIAQSLGPGAGLAAGIAAAAALHQILDD